MSKGLPREDPWSGDIKPTNVVEDRNHCTLKRASGRASPETLYGSLSVDPVDPADGTTAWVGFGMVGTRRRKGGSRLRSAPLLVGISLVALASGIPVLAGGQVANAAPGGATCSWVTATTQSPDQRADEVVGQMT